MNRSYQVLLVRAVCVAALGGLAGCGSGAGPDVQQTSAKPDTFTARLADATDGSSVLQTTTRTQGTDVVVAVSTTAQVETPGLFIRLDYDPAQYAPLVASATGAFAPLASSLTLERLDTPGSLEFGQVVLNGNGIAHPGEVLLEVLFKASPATGSRGVRSVPRSIHAVTPLQWDDAAAVLRWYCVNPGDYDQNGQVTVSDLQPLGRHFHESGPFLFSSALSAVDGVADGEINLSDLQPIAVNLGNTVQQYNVYFSQSVADIPLDFASASSLAPLGLVVMSAAQGDPGQQRLSFSYGIEPGSPAGFYWVRPAADGQEGTRSTISTGPGGGLPPLDGFNVAPTAELSLTLHGAGVPLDATLDASGSSDSDGTIISYEWDFEGDGLYDAWGAQASVQHAYLQPGTCAPRVRVLDNDGAVAVFAAPPFTATFQSVSNIAPVADIAATALTSPAPATLGLLASGSRDVDGAIVKYEWDFDGDGTNDLDSGADPTILHTYSTAGTYNTSVRVTDNRGGQATDMLQLTVTSSPAGNILPSANLQTDTASGVAPLTIHFDASGSSDPDGSIIEFAWDFDGDGIYDGTSEQPLVNHTYTTPGQRTAKLRVTDDGGGRATATVDIATTSVGNQPPVAALTADVFSGNVPLTVHFDASGSHDPDGSIVEYAWDLDGDGAYDALSDGPLLAHAYTAPGMPTIKVRVTDDKFAQSTATLAINTTLANNNPPVAVLDTDSAVSGYDPVVVQFYARDSTAGGDPGDSIVKYEWDWEGNGVYDAITTNSSSYHIYTGRQSFFTRLRVTDEAGNQALSNPVNVYSIPYAGTALDATGMAGTGAGFAVIGGRPAISYYDDSNQVLRYMQASDASGSYWEPSTVVTTAKSSYAVGQYFVNDQTSLCAVNGLPAITYMQNALLGTMYFVRALDSAGTTWGSPVTLPIAANTCTLASLQVVAGQPAIAYMFTSGSSRQLGYIRALDADGATWGSESVLPSTALWGVSNLAIVDGRPALSYATYASGTGALYYLRASDAQGNAWGAPTTVIASGTFSFPVLAVINGRPALASYHQFVRASDIDGVAWGTPVTLPEGSDTPWSLAEVKGKPVLLTYGQNGLQYLNAGDANGSNWPDRFAIEHTFPLGRATLLEVNGQPAMAYMGTRQNLLDLMYVRDPQFEF